jgi:hypothetical protein
VVVVGGGGGARAAGRWARCLGFYFFCFMKIALPRAISPLGTRVTRAYDVALGKELFVGPAVPRALCREQRALCREEAPLGRARDSGSEKGV